MAEHPEILNANAIIHAWRISYLSNFFHGPIYKAIRETYGLTRPDFVVLFCLHHSDEIVSATDICRVTGLPKNSISRAVSRLRKSGTIARKPDAADNRRQILRMTKPGDKLLRRILPLFVAREADMLEVLDRTERNELNRLLAKLVDRDDDWASVF